MKTTKYLKSLGLPIDAALARLESDHGVRCNLHEGTGLIVLNYLIDAKKDDRVACECRSLVLDLNFDIVSRGFDRFFNYEEKKPPHKISAMMAYEKIDGSIMTLFHWGGQWVYRTRKMILPEQPVQGYDTTWAELVQETILSKGTEEMDPEVSYIFELVAPENRVVVKHTERKAYFLAARHNQTGEYRKFSSEKWQRPQSYTFKTYEDCKKATEGLPNLEEGYVMYSPAGAPVSKIKNPAYVAAHHLKGEGLSRNRVIELVVTGESAEYLAIFPEDRDFITPYIVAWGSVFHTANRLWDLHEGATTPKDFALAVKDTPVSALLFGRRQGRAFEETIGHMSTVAKRSLLASQLQETPTDA